MLSGFSMLALVLGMGGVTAMFAVVAGVLLRPLPYPDSERLVHVVRVTEAGESDLAISFPDFTDIGAGARTLSGTAAWRSWGYTMLDADGGSVVGRGSSVSASFFDVLGVRPALGRFFEGSDGALGHDRWWS